MGDAAHINLEIEALHPRCGKIRADVNRQIIQNSAYGRGRSAFEILFGSGSAGLGTWLLQQYG